MRRLAVLFVVAGMTAGLSGASPASATIWCADELTPACAVVQRVVCKYQPRICEVTVQPK